ncbi:thermonuclease family protein [Xanthobacter sp. TB0139]|uniref:thermonuclease family protein n=1 Tax=Xanthobacter sp. TB0139 TaxID=3459178 RepID=UPI00403A44AF
MSARPPIAFAALWLAIIPAQAEPLAGRASVIDGDTIEVHGTRIRLAGIDAPESRQICTHKTTGARQRCGQQAALWLADWIGPRPVTCTPAGRDKYRRTLARCTVAGQDIGAAMVRAGWALPYMAGGKAYKSELRAAQKDKAGLWATRFKRPWEWRRPQNRK